MTFILNRLARVALVIACLTPASLLAFTPGKWDPMDTYIEGARKGGPRALIVYDADGKIRQSAEYQYDQSGRLLKEVYINSAGKKEGSTEYEYRAGNIAGERLFDKNGKLVERKVYLYSRGKLSGIQVYDDKDQEIMQVDYSHKGDRIHVAEEKRDRALDRVVFHYKDERLNKLEVKDDQGKVFSHTRFDYGKNGKLVRRERFQGGRRYLCKYLYNKSGSVAQYEYLVFNPEKNQWQLQKRLAFKF